MKKIIFATSLLMFNVTCFAKGLTNVTSNAVACETPADRDIGICIQNSTGESIQDNNIKIVEETYDSDGGSGGQWLSYSTTANNHFITLATSKKMMLSAYLTKVRYLLETKEKTIYNCAVSFNKETPPYKYFATLILKKNNDGYYCQITS